MAILKKDSLSFGEITVVGDDVKTISQVLVDLMGQITSLSALKGSTYIDMDGKQFFRFSYRTVAGKCYFSVCNVLDDTNFEGSTILLDFSTTPYSASYKDYDSSTGNITTYNPVIGPQTSFTLHF